MAANTNLAVAIHAMTVLGYTKDLATSEFIANSVNANPVIVRKILAKLVKAGLVHSEAGKKGGFMLRKPADKISLLDISNALEAISVFALHQYPETRPCPVSCNIKKVLTGVFEAIDHNVEKSLKKVKLSDIVQAM